MSFFKKERSGPKVGSDAKKAGGIPGVKNGEYIIDVSFKLNGAGEQQGYDQNVMKRSGANK